jgi:hypothetical protein
MATIVTRAGKGSPLTNTEVDNNFTNLNTDKLETSGGTLTGNLSFGDNDKAIFGAGSDLQIYHDGLNSYIDEQGNGGLNVRGTNLNLTDSAGVRFLRGESGGPTRFYHQGTEVLTSTSTGIDVTGTVTADGLTVDGEITGPNSNNLTVRSKYSATIDIDSDNNQTDRNFQVIHDGSKLILKAEESGDISFYEATGTTPKFFWDASAEHLYVGDRTTGIPTVVTGAGLMVTGTSPTGVDGGQLVIKSSELSATAGNGGGIVFDNYNGAGNRVFGAIQVLKENSTSGNNDSFMRFTTRSNSGGLAERMRIDSSGNVGIGTSSPTTDTGTNLDVFTSNGGGAARLHIEHGLGKKWRLFSDSLGSFGVKNQTDDLTAMLIDSSGNVGIGTSSPSASYKLHVAGSIIVDSSSILNLNGTSTAANPQLLLGQGGVGIFRPASDVMGFSTNDTERMRIDSSGNVGIGTSSPSSFYAGAKNLVVGSGSAENGITIYSGTASDGNIYFADGTVGADAYRGFMEYSHASNYFRIGVNGSEAMRIDSSGNLLVGTTSTTIQLSSSLEGFSYANGFVTSSRSEGVTAYFNRLTSDGDIAVFRKDGTTVGSIGSRGGLGLVVDSRNSYDLALSVNSTVSTYVSSNKIYSATDNFSDLGSLTNRFKNLYLSGGVYLGGTGAANHLDDYEEGTWTPTDANGVGITGFATSYYEKIGRTVIARTTIQNITGSSASRIDVGGFPFTSGGATNGGMGGFITYTSCGETITVYMSAGETEVQLYQEDGTSFTGAEGAGHQYQFTVIYQAA